MSKSLIVNTDSMLLLKDRESIIESYDSLIFNCDSILISDEMYAKALAANAVINCDNMNVIKTPQNPVRVNGLLTIDANSDYIDCFVVCDNVHITAGGAAAIAKMEGMAVLGTLYHPQSMGGALSTVRASSVVAYPDDARLVVGDAHLSMQNLGKWRRDTKYFLSRTVFALEEEVLRAMKAQNTSFFCKKLYLYQKDVEEFGNLFSADNVQLVPDGHAVAERSATLMDLYAAHGERIYLLDDVTVQPRDVRHLPLLQSLIVKGTAHLPMEHLRACKEVIEADAVHVFEGELMGINGFAAISHAMLAAANANGICYTLNVNGVALFEEDVTYEDVKAIASIRRINGAISAPGVTHAHLNAVAEKINGALLGSLSEIRAMIEAMPGEAGTMFGQALPGPIAKMLGIVKEEREGNSAVINSDSYTLM